MKQNIDDNSNNNSNASNNKNGSLQNYQFVQNSEVRRILHRFGYDQQWNAFIGEQIKKQHNKQSIYLDADYAIFKYLQKNVVFERFRADYDYLGLGPIFQRMIERQRKSKCSCNLRAVLDDPELMYFIERNLVFQCQSQFHWCGCCDFDTDDDTIEDKCSAQIIGDACRQFTKSFGDCICNINNFIKSCHKHEFSEMLMKCKDSSKFQLKPCNSRFHRWLNPRKMQFAVQQLCLKFGRQIRTQPINMEDVFIIDRDCTCPYMVETCKSNTHYCVCALLGDDDVHQERNFPKRCRYQFFPYLEAEPQTGKLSNFVADISNQFFCTNTFQETNFCSCGKCPGKTQLFMRMFS